MCLALLWKIETSSRTFNNFDKMAMWYIVLIFNLLFLYACPENINFDKMYVLKTLNACPENTNFDKMAM